MVEEATCQILPSPPDRPSYYPWEEFLTSQVKIWWSPFQCLHYCNILGPLFFSQAKTWPAGLFLKCILVCILRLWTQPEVPLFPQTLSSSGFLSPRLQTATPSGEKVLWAPGEWWIKISLCQKFWIGNSALPEVWVCVRVCVHVCVCVCVIRVAPFWSFPSLSTWINCLLTCLHHWEFVRI